MATDRIEFTMNTGGNAPSVCERAEAATLAFAAELRSRACTTSGDPDDVVCEDAACPQHGDELCGHGILVGVCAHPLCQPSAEDEAP